MRKLGGLLVGAGLVVTVACSSSDPEKYPVTLTSISMLEGRAIAGGADGYIYASNDYKEWFGIINISSAPIEAVFRDKEIEVAVAGPHWARSNGSAWVGFNTQEMGVQTTLAGAAACLKGKYLVGSGGFVARTTNGNSWIPVQGIDKGADLVDLACGRTNMLVASLKQTSGHWLSTDGEKFTKVTSPVDTCSVIHAGTLYYVLGVDGRVFTSPDEGTTTWTEISRVPWPKPVPFCTLRHVGDTFCASGDDILVCSPDGKTWTEVDIPEKGKISDFDIDQDGRLIAVGLDRWICNTRCTNGTCERGTVSRLEAGKLTQRPFFSGSGAGSSSGSSGGSSGSSGGTCDPCKTDADCSALAKRNGVAGAACHTDGLCYPCFQVCSAGSVNCRCITCGEAGGCGTDAQCTGPTQTLCAVRREGKKPCE
jgi:hypothetical protein